MSRETRRRESQPVKRSGDRYLGDFTDLLGHLHHPSRGRSDVGRSRMDHGWHYLAFQRRTMYVLRRCTWADQQSSIITTTLPQSFCLAPGVHIPPWTPTSHRKERRRSLRLVALGSCTSRSLNGVTSQDSTQRFSFPSSRQSQRSTNQTGRTLLIQQLPTRPKLSSFTAHSWPIARLRSEVNILVLQPGQPLARSGLVKLVGGGGSLSVAKSFDGRAHQRRSSTVVSKASVPSTPSSLRIPRFRA